MTVNAKIIAHTRAAGAPDLITLQVRFPWWLLPEMNTHRAFSRNYGSTRAIPISRLIDEANNDPALPVKWTSHLPGMQGGDDLSANQIVQAETIYLKARDQVVEEVRSLLNLGIAKQNANRLLMPFIHVEGIVTATEWDNFYALRRHADADPTMEALANAMWETMQASTPVEDHHHLPYVSMEERQSLVVDHKLWVSDVANISAARCARVSYLNHDGSKPVISKDQALSKMLLDSMHMSPFEHQATRGDDQSLWGNLTGWHQYRKELEHSHGAR